jgi:predicted NACHT family NTPase
LSRVITLKRLSEIASIFRNHQPKPEIAVWLCSIEDKPLCDRPAMSEPFQPYLESICVTYAQWWQLYTLTDAAGKAQQAKQTAPTFDFGLMVQAIAPQKAGMERGDSGDRPEKIERFGVLEGLRKYADRHVLLVGRPGSGKSTALARLMFEAATN